MVIKVRYKQSWQNHRFTNLHKGYHSWRKLGDAISSTFALGYHENIEAKPGIPSFLKELRKTAFARIYSADKNIAIFLGRPPRMNKRFCYFQIPSCQNADGADWTPDAEAGYRADTRWSALCASLKEEVWELLQDKHDPSCAQRARYALQCYTRIRSKSPGTNLD